MWTMNISPSLKHASFLSQACLFHLPSLYLSFRTQPSYTQSPFGWHPVRSTCRRWSWRGLAVVRQPLILRFSFSIAFLPVLCIVFWALNHQVSMAWFMSACQKSTVSLAVAGVTTIQEVACYELLENLIKHYLLELLLITNRQWQCFVVTITSVSESCKLVGHSLFVFDYCCHVKPLDHNHPTSPLLAKPPELSEEVKLPPSMKFVAANTVGE